MLLSCFLFFKQKTAYEMRISDWSSDVCSSDLPAVFLEQMREGVAEADQGVETVGAECLVEFPPVGHLGAGECHAHLVGIALGLLDHGLGAVGGGHREARVGEADGVEAGSRGDVGDLPAVVPAQQRSEEHTSELQSLMRISYAVFCLKKK